jgi:hypothetical protein
MAEGWHLNHSVIKSLTAVFPPLNSGMFGIPRIGTHLEVGGRQAISRDVRGVTDEEYEKLRMARVPNSEIS